MIIHSTLEHVCSHAVLCFSVVLTYVSGRQAVLQILPHVLVSVGWSRAFTRGLPQTYVLVSAVVCIFVAYMIHPIC